MPTTRRAADVAAEIADQLRVLNHATAPADGYPGLAWVADVYEVLGSLRLATERLEQTVNQAGSFLAHTAEAGGLRVDDGTPYAGAPDTAIDQACAGLIEAERLIGELGRLFDHSAQAIAGVAHTRHAPDAHTRDDDDGPDEAA